jgi:alkylhydroperoxidase family enzyme
MHFENQSARIAPLEPPYAPETEASLRRLMGTDAVEPLTLFRTLARHSALLERFRQTGSTLLAHGLMDPEDRETLILRTTARCGAAYEWGVHAAGFAPALGLGEPFLVATWAGMPEDAAFSPRAALLVRLADELHDTGTVGPALWDALAATLTETELLEAIAVCGFYHLVSYFCGALRLAPEPWAAEPPLTSPSP